MKIQTGRRKPLFCSLAKSPASLLAPVLTLLVLMLGACSEKTPEPKSTESTHSEQAGISPDPEWTEHIQGYSQGWVPAAKPLHIQFTHPVVAEDKLNSPLDGLVIITPAVEFEAIFTSTTTLSLTPKQPFPAGKVYSLSLAPQGLLDVPDSLRPFDFRIQVLNQDYELQISGLVSSSQEGQMKLTGSIRTADTVDNTIESTLTVQQQGETLPLIWHHDANQRAHSFTVEGIKRSESTNEILLNYNAQAIGVEKKGTHKITVPKLEKFVITGTRAIQRPKQLVEVSFSEALDRNQNLNGLVLLNGENARVQVDGSVLKIYPAQPLSGVSVLDIEATLKSAKNIPLDEKHQSEIVFTISELPGVRFLDGGTFAPPTESLTIPFEAINVHTVWVRAFKIYENNIQDYIQNYKIDSGVAYRHHGRALWRKKITLPSIPLDQWKRYDIDISELTALHGEGIVNLEVSIDQSTTVYDCPENSPAPGNRSQSQAEIFEDNYDGPNIQEDVERPSWFNQYYSPENGYLTAAQRENPCHPGYYSHYYAKNVRAAKNIFVSDLGLIVKRGSGNKLHVVATGITRGEALENASIRVYNYQHQLLASKNTDANGMAIIEPEGAGFYVLAEYDGNKTYLRLPVNEALPVSQFDTGGKKNQQGLKGLIYGERDVWRPGDNIYLTFILQDLENRLPTHHPVSLDFFDPRGTKHSTTTSRKPEGDMYVFTLKTDASSPTGNWRAVVRVGGEYFDKVIKIEAIVPNRLQVDLEPAQRPMQETLVPIRVEIFAQWLNGATAKNLKADAEMKLTPMKTTFDGWSQYTFDDPASNFKKFQKMVFDNTLDNEGRAAFDVDLQSIQQAPGKLRATFVTRVFEKSGNFSTSIRQEEVLPYDHWVGLNIPKGDGYQDAISKDKDHAINFLTLTSNGKAVADKELNVSVYRIGWRWWWDQSEENLANYISGRNSNKVAEATITSDDKGRASWQLEKDKYEWGRHLIRVCEKAGGHCSGQEVYLGWSWSNQVSPDSATQLMLGTDKEKYQVGDVAVINIPQLAQGKILYSLENGSRVLQQRWLDLEPGASSFSIPVTQEMAPNVYVNAVLLLPHLDREADAPIRMYGITPILVSNPESHLTPTITSPETVRPSATFEVTVKEKNSRAMSYTLAVVDEGLLGITAYQAPNPHTTFYRREALGVFTWDMFDGVIGAYGANLERLLKIGGGDAGKDEKSSTERRFPPVVKFLGAFTLEAGESQTHSVQLPQYMGAVRVMVVGAAPNAYGKAEKTVRVTQALTLLATLPRVLGPKEKVALPVQVFVSKDNIKEVDIRVHASDLFESDEPEPGESKTKSRKLVFDEPGDQIAMLELAVKDRIGPGTVRVVAQSGTEKTEQTIHIQSRSPNTASTQRQAHHIQPGEVWQANLSPHGMLNTNVSSVTVSSFPPLNLDKHLDYLIGYPHGCLEQTTSTIFPQIWLQNIIQLSPKQLADIQNNVEAALNKYKSFQTGSSGFSYWPGGNYTNNWAHIYATHFLIEAKALGYPVPNTLLTDAVQFLRTMPGLASGNQNHHYSSLVNAYRLYVLARASSPDVAAMNRAREALLSNPQHYDDQVARWKLALAYQAIGLLDIAQELITGGKNPVQDYRYSDYTYGSSLRDHGILLMSYSAIKNEDNAWAQAKEVARLLSQDRRYSTHSTAWAFIALAHYAKGRSDEKNIFSISEFGHQEQDSNRQWQAIQSIKTFYKQSIEPQVLKDGQLMLRNDSKHPLHIEVSNTGIPSGGQETASSRGLTLDVAFVDTQGNALNVAALPQGQDFIAEVTIRADNSHNSYKIEDIATTMVVPSGWQIRNERLEGDAIPDGLDYQDIRDDRLMSYFSLWKNHHWYYRYNDRDHNSQKIRVVLNASFAGKFYLPGWQVKSMYDEEIVASTVGQWVEVIQEAGKK